MTSQAEIDEAEVRAFVLKVTEIAHDALGPYNAKTQEAGTGPLAAGIVQAVFPAYLENRTRWRKAIKPSPPTPTPITDF
jgi:hypothetical protein